METQNNEQKNKGSYSPYIKEYYKRPEVKARQSEYYKNKRKEVKQLLALIKELNIK